MTEPRSIDAISLGIQNLGNAVQACVGVPPPSTKSRPRPNYTEKNTSSEESSAVVTETSTTNVSEEDRVRKMQLNLDITQRREQASGKESQKKMTLPTKSRMYWNKDLKEMQTLAETVCSYLFIYNLLNK